MNRRSFITKLSFVAGAVVTLPFAAITKPKEQLTPRWKLPTDYLLTPKPWPPPSKSDHGAFDHDRFMRDRLIALRDAHKVELIRHMEDAVFDSWHHEYGLKHSPYHVLEFSRWLHTTGKER